MATFVFCSKKGGFPAILALFSVLLSLSRQHEAPPKTPNILFILTDDQDVHMDSLSYMPFLKQHITDEGTLFQRHYCTVALCCPSRVNMWTGKAAHNTNVTDLSPPYGPYKYRRLMVDTYICSPVLTVSRWLSEIHRAGFQ